MVVKMKDYGLIAHLKMWGLDVEEQDGWRFRGRPYNFYPKAIFVHHTASNRYGGNFPALGTVVNGRPPSLPGPLSQFMLGRDGTVKVIAAGYSNHAGYGGPRANIPKDQGNTYAIGIEAENNGIGEPWNARQLNAYYRLCAALMDWLGIKDVNQVIGHKEWAFGRKIDPAGIDMNKFRANVQKALDQGTNVVKVRISRLTGARRFLPSTSTKRVKRRLKRRGFYSGPVDRKYSKAYKDAYAKFQRNLGYQGSDADGIPGETSLERLGFKVVK